MPRWAREIFDIAKAHTEAVIQPDGVADDLGGNTVSVVAWRVGGELLLSPQSVEIIKFGDPGSGR